MDVHDTLVFSPARWSRISMLQYVRRYTLLCCCCCHSFIYLPLACPVGSCIGRSPPSCAWPVYPCQSGAIYSDISAIPSILYKLQSNDIPPSFSETINLARLNVELLSDGVVKICSVKIGYQVSSPTASTSPRLASESTSAVAVRAPKMRHCWLYSFPCSIFGC